MDGVAPLLPAMAAGAGSGGRRGKLAEFPCILASLSIRTMPVLVLTPKPRRRDDIDIDTDLSCLNDYSGDEEVGCEEVNDEGKTVYCVGASSC